MFSWDVLFGLHEAHFDLPPANCVLEKLMTSASFAFDVLGLSSGERKCAERTTAYTSEKSTLLTVRLPGRNVASLLSEFAFR